MMSEDQKGDESKAEENESYTIAGEQPPAQLLEIDECGRGLSVLDPRPPIQPDAEERPGIIYIEFAKSLREPRLVVESQPSEEKEAAANVEDGKLRSFLRESGLVRSEPSFSPEAAPERQRFWTLYFESNADVNRISQELNRWPQVEHAVVAPRLMHPSPVGDPLAEPFVGFPPSDQVVTIKGFDNQWYISRCRIDQAWGQGLSGNGVVVADIDWGFLTTHEDLKDRIALRCNALHKDDNVSRGAVIHHGTAVLGLAGAGSNSKGMAGVAFGASLWAIQAGEELGKVEAPFWWAAIDCVSKKESEGRRKVIILEVETFDSENIEMIPQIRTVIESAIAGGSVVCVAAGNGHRNAGVDKNNNPFPPTGSILVGATKYDPSENPIADFSNFGPRVTIYAPGDESHDLTCSSEADNGYRNRFGGTSGATAKVAGVAALMLQVNNKLTHAEIFDILKLTGTPIRNDPTNAGVFLDAGAAVCEARKLAGGSC